MCLIKFKGKTINQIQYYSSVRNKLCFKGNSEQHRPTGFLAKKWGNENGGTN